MFDCVSDSALHTSKQLSFSADCVFAGDYAESSDFMSSATGQNSHDRLEVKSQDESKQARSIIEVHYQV